MNIFDATIGHIISQLTYRWFPPNSPLELSNSEDITKLSTDEWSDYLGKHEFDDSKVWTKPFHKLLDSSRDVLLKELSYIADASSDEIGYLSICDPNYPYLLRQIKDPPLGLFYRGNIQRLDSPAIAIVGSRKASSDALLEAQNLANILVHEGGVVVSGGAIGCDTSAHFGAFDDFERSLTIAVMAGGVDRLLPRCNDALFRKVITQGGLVISERLRGTDPRPRDFPIRNRIISGLSSRTIIMQAAQRSGAIATANLALAQGRDVMVYLPRLGDIRFLGNESLRDAGAPSFSSAEAYFQMKWE